MAFKFEGLRTWQLSMDLAKRVNEIADRFPKKELYNLSFQSRRAADSVSLNIAEGSTGCQTGTNKISRLCKSFRTRNSNMLIQGKA